MGYSKRQFIEAALEEIGLAVYNFDISPEQEEAALRQLDSMMASWNASGIRIGYPLPSSPEDSEITAPSGVPDAANEAIRTNLACRLAPSYGKTVMPDTKVAAATTLNLLRSRFAVIPEMQLRRNTPLGAGNKPWLWNRGPFIATPIPSVDAGPDQSIEYI